MQFWKSQFTKQFREALSASSREGEAPAEPPRHLWQTGHWDRRRRSGESYDAKWDYVVNIPFGMVWQNTPQTGRCRREQ
jgi:hypothetical protein